MDIKSRLKLGVAAAALLLLTASCTARNVDDGRVYNQRGMEISKVARTMADELYHTLYVNTAIAAGYTDAATRPIVRNVTLPSVAITSFVDTDTYEEAGHLGRIMAEMFVHELNVRQINVYEYKLTGALSVAPDGEYIYSRDYRKLLNEASVSHVLSGTISRNNQGVVLVGRIVDLENHMVKASATGFIPYSLLPYCYRTKEKQCSLGDISEYLSQAQLDDEAYRQQVLRDIERNQYKNAAASWEQGLSISSAEPALAQAPVRTAEGGYVVSGGGEGIARAPSSQGNLNNGRATMHDQDPLIYEGSSYVQGTRLARDIGPQSQYQRKGDE